MEGLLSTGPTPSSSSRFEVLGSRGGAGSRILVDLPNWGVFRQIAKNFWDIFKIDQKRPKKLPNATKTLKKLTKKAQNFYKFVKSSPKASKILSKPQKTFQFLSKIP